MFFSNDVLNLIWFSFCILCSTRIIIHLNPLFSNFDRYLAVLSAYLWSFDTRFSLGFLDFLSIFYNDHSPSSSIICCHFLEVGIFLQVSMLLVLMFHLFLWPKSFGSLQALFFKRIFKSSPQSCFQPFTCCFSCFFGSFIWGSLKDIGYRLSWCC